MKKGIYALLLFLEDRKRLRVGKLGEFCFPGGYYIYVGSGLGGLARRIERHKSRDKRFHWHIDHLLAHARLVAVWTYPTGERLGCFLNRAISQAEGAEVVARKFDSSDCKCPTHLWRMAAWTFREEALKGWKELVEGWTDADWNSGVAQRGQVHLIYGLNQGQG